MLFLLYFRAPVACNIWSHSGTPTLILFKHGSQECMCTWGGIFAGDQYVIVSVGICTCHATQTTHFLLELMAFARISNEQRMHSSRMRTFLCSGRLGDGKGCLSEGCLPRDVCPGVCLPRGCTPALPCGQNSWHTLLKTLPLLNYHCGR